MASKKKRGRTERREIDRASAKLTRDLERLAELEPGGAPDRPIRITSPTEVEVHTRSAVCPRCRGEYEMIEHAAETIAGRRLRVARIGCRSCGVTRAIYFELAGATLN